MVVYMPKYAVNTTVSVEKSQQEIQRILQRFGCDQFLYGWQENQAVIAFRAHERQIKFVLTMPRKDLPEFTEHSRGARTEDAAYRLWEQACRQRWRALALVIKAKLEAVECGITCFEDEFLAHIVLPDGMTVGAAMRPQIALAYETGDMPKLLPDYSQ